MSESSKKGIIVINGGAVQAWHLPDGVTIEIRDYDCEPDSNFANHIDDEGDECQVVLLDWSNSEPIGNFPDLNVIEEE